jgi:hypothetical protein
MAIDSGGRAEVNGLHPPIGAVIIEKEPQPGSVVKIPDLIGVHAVEAAMLP